MIRHLARLQKFNDFTSVEPLELLKWGAHYTGEMGVERKKSDSHTFFDWNRYIDSFRIWPYVFSL